MAEQKITKDTYNDFINSLKIPEKLSQNDAGLAKELLLKLVKLQAALRDEGYSEENCNVIQKTEELIYSVLDFRQITDVSALKEIIAKYQQEVSNLSLSQKVLIAAMTFLGALVGFVIGAVIGGVVSVGNPLAILAGGGTAAAIGAGVGGAVAGGGGAFFLSRFGVFKQDPVKAAAREFVKLVDDYDSEMNRIFPQKQ